MLGHVIWYNPKIGYGFIAEYKTGASVHVHYSNVICISERPYKSSLAAGQPVGYKVGKAPDGRITAKDVKPLSIDEIKIELNLADLENYSISKPEKCFNPVLKR